MKINRNELEGRLIMKLKRRRVKFIIASAILISVILVGSAIAWAQNNDTSAQDETETSKVFSELLKDVILLVAGGFIGVSSSLGTSYISHRFKMQEEQIIREFEARKTRTDFFCSLYGHISILSELMGAYKRAYDDNKAGIISENGFVYLTRQEISDRFRENHREFSSFFYKNRKQGFEVYFPQELANNLASFWAYASIFEEGEPKREVLEKMELVSLKITVIIEELLGIA